MPVADFLHAALCIPSSNDRSYLSPSQATKEPQTEYHTRLIILNAGDERDDLCFLPGDLPLQKFNSGFQVSDLCSEAAHLIAHTGSVGHTGKYLCAGVSCRTKRGQHFFRPVQPLSQHEMSIQFFQGQIAHPLRAGYFIFRKTSAREHVLKWETYPNPLSSWRGPENAQLTTLPLRGRTTFPAAPGRSQ